MLTVLSGMGRWTGMDGLAAVLAARERDRAQRAYNSQLLWHIGAALWAMREGSVWQMPDYFSLFPPRRMPGEGTRAGILRQVLRSVKGGMKNA